MTIEADLARLRSILKSLLHRVDSCIGDVDHPPGNGPNGLNQLGYERRGWWDRSVDHDFVLWRLSHWLGCGSLWFARARCSAFSHA
jgi:hypothetical protein